MEKVALADMDYDQALEAAAEKYAGWDDIVNTIAPAGGAVSKALGSVGDAASSAWQMPEVRHGLYGAGAGAALGGLSSFFRPESSFLGSALTGAVTGGALGAGSGAITRAMGGGQLDPAKAKADAAAAAERKRILLEAQKELENSRAVDMVMPNTFNPLADPNTHPLAATQILTPGAALYHGGRALTNRQVTDPGSVTDPSFLARGVAATGAGKDKAMQAVVDRLSAGKNPLIDNSPQPTWQQQAGASGPSVLDRLFGRQSAPVNPDVASLAGRVNPQRGFIDRLFNRTPGPNASDVVLGPLDTPSQTKAPGNNSSAARAGMGGTQTTTPGKGSLPAVRIQDVRNLIAEGAKARLADANAMSGSGNPQVLNQNVVTGGYNVGAPVGFKPALKGTGKALALGLLLDGVRQLGAKAWQGRTTNKALQDAVNLQQKAGSLGSEMLAGAAVRGGLGAGIGAILGPLLMEKEKKDEGIARRMLLGAAGGGLAGATVGALRPPIDAGLRSLLPPRNNPHRPTMPSGESFAPEILAGDGPNTGDIKMAGLSDGQISALRGLVLGAGAGAIYNYTQDKKDRNLLGNILTGASVGGLGGAVLPSITSGLRGGLTGTVAGAGAGMGGGAVAGEVAHDALGPAGGAAGGAVGGGLLGLFAGPPVGGVLGALAGGLHGLTRSGGSSQLEHLQNLGDRMHKAYIPRAVLSTMAGGALGSGLGAANEYLNKDEKERSLMGGALRGGALGAAGGAAASELGTGFGGGTLGAVTGGIGGGIAGPTAGAIMGGLTGGGQIDMGGALRWADGLDRSLNLPAAIPPGTLR